MDGMLRNMTSVYLTGEQGIGNLVRTFGNGLFCQAGIKTHLVPQSVADLAFGLQEIYHFGVIFVGRKVKRIPVENEIPVQINIIFVISALVFHAVRIYVGNHQHARGVLI